MQLAYSIINTEIQLWNLGEYYARIIVSARGVSECLLDRHPVLILDTLFYLSFTCKSIVSEQCGHPVLKFPVNLYTVFLHPG